MGSLGNDNGDINPSQKNPNTYAEPETQPLDLESQFSLPPFSGDKVDKEDEDGVEYLQSTVPLDDDNDVAVYDALETQVVNFDEEAQVLKFGGETQVLDDFVETQLLDEFDDQVALDSDGEGTDQTVVLDDGDEVLSDEVKGDSIRSLGKEGTKHSLEQCNASADEQRSSETHVSTATPDVRAGSESKPGSMRMFTSVRAASLRASGLAARNAALRQKNSSSCFIQTDSRFSDQGTVISNGLNSEVPKKITRTHDQEATFNENSIGSRVGFSTARQLFREDSFGENRGFSCSSENVDAREDLFQFSECDGSSAGLSYIDSQEPGELSQANALDFVDKLVDNMMEHGYEVDLGKCNPETSKLNSSAKGPQSLAKKTSERSTAGETGIFEWDDSMEDEGGGDIYRRRKEEFYGSGICAQKSSTLPQIQKPRVMKVDVSCNEDRRKSDSKLLCKSKNNDKTVQKSQMSFRKNLINEFDDQFNPDASRGQLEATAEHEGDPEVVNVGPDTQMAAEAMEALFYAEGSTDQNANQGVQTISKSSFKDSLSGKSRKRISSRETRSGKVVQCSDASPVARGSKKTKLSKQSSLLQEKHSKNVRGECDTELVLPKLKNAKTKSDDNQIAGGIGMYKLPAESNQKADGALESSQLLGTRRSTRGRLKHLEKVHTFIPVAHRTRQSLVMNMPVVETPSSDCRKGRKHRKEAGFVQEDARLPEGLNAKGKLSKSGSKQSGDCCNVKSSKNEQSHVELITRSNVNHAMSYPKQRSSCQETSINVGGSDNGEAQSGRSIQKEDNGQSVAGVKRSRSNYRSTHIFSTNKRITRSSVNTCPVMISANQNSEGKLSHQSSDKLASGDDMLNCKSTEMHGKMIPTSIIGSEQVKASKHSEGKCVAVPSPVAESLAVNITLDKSPKEKSKSPGSVCNTPVNCRTPSNATSPICMGDEYFKQSCKKSLPKPSLIKELRSLNPTEPEPEPVSPLKVTRKRKDLANVRVLFSNHLAEKTVRKQKQILARLGISEASSILDATHFITDCFVRTRNMLEAIACGKPIVNSSWLGSIEQVNIHIDEETYIMRDPDKEKELGFCMPVSLALARKRPLLQGQRVLITPNTKPGKDTISHLVSAACGQVLERIRRSAMEDDKVPEDLLILSCEQDYELCIPFLEKGLAVYSSELLLNGIVTQKLDYGRHRLFADKVKRTRSTVWVKRNNKFLPVKKNK